MPSGEENKTCVLEYPDAMNASDLQIWNNAAFDNGDSEDPSLKAPSWSPLKPIFVVRSESLESDSSKENQGPAMGKSPVSVPIKPLQPNCGIRNSQSKLIEVISKSLKNENDENFRDERKIDAEIEEIGAEIGRLNSKLEALRLEKAERNVKTIERRARIVGSKFMGQNQKLCELKKIEELMSVTKKTPRRAISMDPSEILAGVQKGRVSIGPREIIAGGKTPTVAIRPISMGPSEIIAGVRKGRVSIMPQEIVARGKTPTARRSEITPVQSIQSRRKSCFWKLQDIDETKVVNEKGKKSLSLSPKPRKTISSKIQNAKQAATTTIIGGRKHLKKEEVILSSIQPKKLFKDCEQSVSSKKPLKSGRLVASRYNESTQCNTNFSAIRKRSLPETGKEESTNVEKKRASYVGQQFGDLMNEGRVKKKWEIPSSIVIHKMVSEDEEGDSTSPITKMPDLLPRIRTDRFNFESPRDSGPAKRVSELVRKKPFFSMDDDDGEEEEVVPVCQALDFAEANEDV